MLQKCVFCLFGKTAESGSKQDKFKIITSGARKQGSTPRLMETGKKDIGAELVGPWLAIFGAIWISKNIIIIVTF